MSASLGVVLALLSVLTDRFVQVTADAVDLSDAAVEGRPEHKLLLHTDSVLTLSNLSRLFKL